MSIFLVILVKFSMVATFLAGKFHERKKWNELIEDGVIPTPNKKK